MATNENESTQKTDKLVVACDALMLGFDET
jgi:hypothetical protein